MKLPAPVARHTGVIAQQPTHSGRRLALELLLRGVAVVVTAVLILGILPVITRAAG